MSKWWWKADYVETCNCAHACPCNLTMLPTHGACHGMNIYRIREGECDGVKLNGLHLVLAFSWPGPIHRGNGKGIDSFDIAPTVVVIIGDPEYAMMPCKMQLALWMRPCEMITAPS